MAGAKLCLDFDSCWPTTSKSMALAGASVSLWLLLKRRYDFGASLWFSVHLSARLPGRTRSDPSESCVFRAPGAWRCREHRPLRPGKQLRGRPTSIAFYHLQAGMCPYLGICRNTANLEQQIQGQIEYQAPGCPWNYPTQSAT